MVHGFKTKSGFDMKLELSPFVALWPLSRHKLPFLDPLPLRSDLERSKFFDFSSSMTG